MRLTFYGTTSKDQSGMRQWQTYYAMSPLYHGPLTSTHILIYCRMGSNGGCGGTTSEAHGDQRGDCLSLRGTWFVRRRTIETSYSDTNVFYSKGLYGHVGVAGLVKPRTT